ncbi:MAG TPA: 50S ribosomal protein L33 [candidate division WWE3 bacterium]|uniref:Large ribosomal subunit protein bL33 n=1 Tax=candidate division WWE3 bacterium TaxID=2053526 RepID=A0A7C1HVD7_UNCKA|nr:50S ribosomal protein L33 [candidate division WWE3 bacterium]
MASKKKGNRIIIPMECEETGLRAYVTQKNRMTTKDKLRLKKFNHLLKRHSWFSEGKKLK